MGQWRVLVTGGAGYIGCILVEYLLQMGCKVTVLDNFMFRQSGLNHLCENKNLTIVNGDITDRRLLVSPNLKGGWTNAEETWVYASTTTFTISGCCLCKDSANSLRLSPVL